VIAGAGPAGSSLAIRLAVNGFDVTMIERESFPRQKLCGEFISPECFDHFAELGVLDDMKAVGGDRVHETAFYSADGRSVTVPSSFMGADGALSLSRAEMDLQLLKRARAVGVNVIENAYVSELIVRNASVVGVGYRSGGETVSLDADIVVDATGRAAALARLLAKSFAVGDRRPPAKPSFVGFKTHMRHADLAPGRCEIYFFKGGYGGLTNIEDGLANVCFLVKAELVRDHKSNPDEVVQSLLLGNPQARRSLSNAVSAREWIAVPLGEYGRKQVNPAPGLFCVGDSAAFIDPFTGSGMLLAFESSELLFKAIDATPSSQSLIGRQYLSAHEARFNSRLRTAALLRQAAFVPSLASAAIRIAGGSVILTELLTRFTRRRVVSAFSKR